MNKSAIISGAGGALGSVVAKHFQQAGYEVTGLYHKKPETVAENIHREVINLLDAGGTEKMVSDMIAQQSSIDVLVCTAGGFAAGNLADTTAGDVQKQFELNFITAYNLVQPVYEHMKKRGSGHIFLIGSRQGADPDTSTGTVAYGLSKSLLFSLAKMLNKDSKGKVITSMIVPSTIDTEANRKAMPDADFRNWVSPDAIAEVILFYASDKAQAIRQPVIKIFGDS